MSFTLCAEFSIFPDNSPLGPSFTFAAMDFQDVVGGATSFVNETSGERGLQFPDAGLEVDLPLEARWVRMRVGQFNTPYTIEGIDANGGVVRTFNMNFP